MFETKPSLPHYTCVGYGRCPKFLTGLSPAEELRCQLIGYCADSVKSGKKFKDW